MKKIIFSSRGVIFCSNRRRLYKTTCDFLQSTGRFKFVWFVLPPILHSWYFCIFHWVMYHFSLPSCIWDFVYIWLTLWILFFFYGYFFPNPVSQASLLFTYAYLGFCLRLTDFINISLPRYFFSNALFFSYCNSWHQFFILHTVDCH